MGKIEDLIVNGGLYEPVELTVDDLDEIEMILSQSEYTNNTIDCYCMCCKKDRVFHYSNCDLQRDSDAIYSSIITTATVNSENNKRKPKPEEIFNKYMNRRYFLTYCCSKDNSHRIIFDLVTENGRIIKVGQYPSVADLEKSEIKQYRKILGEQDFREYSCAIGLFANGVGIGSFVYLRRIIEKLVFNTYEKFSSTVGVSEEDFKKLHFDDKISTLEGFLPSSLVNRKRLYGIVSKGIHELDEEECLEMFPKIKIGIELILDDILAEQEREKKEKELSRFEQDKIEKFKK